MTRRFQFADAVWFRVPLRVLVVALSVFAMLSLYPALGRGTADDQMRAILGFTVLAAFIVMASVFIVAVDDGWVELDGETLRIRFEAFFNAAVPVASIMHVAPVDPRPRWRYWFGLSTNFVDRIACSHGGRMVEIELSEPYAARLWLRRIAVRRFWLAVVDRDAFLAALRDVAPHAFPALAAAA